MHSHTGFTFSVGKTEISVIFFIFGEHRDTNFGLESLWFRFQIQKYESQTLVKKNEIRYSENEIVNPGRESSTKRARSVLWRPLSHSDAFTS